jgi:hypothetical protein
MRPRALAPAVLVVILIAAVTAHAGWRSHARDCEQDDEAASDPPPREHRRQHQRFDHQQVQPGQTDSHPYWGTMRPYWGPNDPPGTIHRRTRTNDLKKQ